jgi:hypothetical protein
MMGVSTGGFGLPIGIALAIGGVATMFSMLASIPSFDDLPTNKTAMVKSGKAFADPGENITRTEDLTKINKGLEERIDTLIGVMSDNPRHTANRLGDTISEFA